MTSLMTDYCFKLQSHKIMNDNALFSKIITLKLSTFDKE